VVAAKLTQRPGGRRVRWPVPPTRRARWPTLAEPVAQWPCPNLHTQASAWLTGNSPVTATINFTTDAGKGTRS
jgi:hypothetical protein